MSSRRPMRARLLDLAVATVCVVCIAAPLLQVAGAAARQSAVVESGGNVDQMVLQTGVISNPLNASFGSGRTGVVDGVVDWDLYSSAADGMKLVVSTDGGPAMGGLGSGAIVRDLNRRIEPWNVAPNDRRFGVSATGSIALARFENGTRWRGLQGGKAVEVGRSATAIPSTRTTVKLRAEYRRPLARSDRPIVNVEATGVLNL